MLAFIHRKMNFRIWKICGHFQIFGAAHRSAPAPSAREEAAKHAPKSSPCLETAPRDPAALVGQQLQALYVAHSRQQASTLSTVQSPGQICCVEAGTSRVTNMRGSAQTMPGLEDRLSCMWNDVWNDVKATSRCRDFSTWQ